MIFDKVRGVYLKETPEEKVRQGVIAWLEKNGVVPSLIGREVKLKIGGRTLRADIVVYSRDLQPRIVVECKAPEVPITEKVLYQVFEYNRELSCKYVVVTNGKQTYLFEKEKDGFSQIENPSQIFQ